MSFWNDRLGPPKQSEPANPAPGAWWQTQQQQHQNYAQQQPSQAQQAAMQGMPQLQPQQMPSAQEYAPRNSGFVKNRTQGNVADQCPRCGSYDYVEIAAEAARESVYVLPGKSVRCMNCNYPGLDTSEGVIGSTSGTGVSPVISSNVDVKTHKVREQGGRNTSAFQGFSSDNFNRSTDATHVVKIL